MSVSLDGLAETPSRSIDWVQVDEELPSFVNDQSRALSASPYGRRMYVQPVVLGAGRPYFPALDDPIGLELRETRRFGSGVAYLRYTTARHGP